ncbi:Ig-like domain-containing protein [Pseudomarimonas arenosa]|uniref:Ig-like domain-containing protein n=1 Tax=Pseudomarimonas arenosa TaxID=2774145 RepID=A0AAW3ZKG0_9GAMM|nr:Ig-like domain-containing protein [Pseudomarimonas arenosa]MBD8526575.1 Ig-like domain-containing protein [Pseudomarimonas arenosa]
MAMARAARFALEVLVACLVTLIISSVSQAAANEVFRSGFELESWLDRAEVLPAPSTVLDADALPQVGIRWNDGESLTGPWVLVLDGVEIGASAAHSPREVIHTASTPLAEGRHQAEFRYGSLVKSWSFSTRTDPEVLDLSPFGHVEGDDSQPPIRAEYTDVGSGIHLSKVRLVLDGVDVTSGADIQEGGLSYTPSTPLADGIHRADLHLEDRAGNQVLRLWGFVTGADPEISIESPSESLLRYADPLEVRAQVSITRGALRRDSLRLFLNETDIAPEAEIEWDGERRATVRYAPSAPLASGAYQVAIDVAAESGKSAWALRAFEIDIEHQYRLEMVGTIEDSYSSSMRVVALAESTAGAPGTILIAGQESDDRVRTEEGVEYSREVSLTPGPNLIEIVAQFPDGETRRIETTITYHAPTQIEVLVPADLSTLGPMPAEGSATPPGGATNLTGAVQRPVTVRGQSSAPLTEVLINQQLAQLADDGLSFSFPDFFLHEGSNLLSVVGTDQRGHTVTSQITVFVDHTAPLLTIESPSEQAITSQAHIDLRGTVNDAVEGLIGAPEPTVTVDNTTNGETVTAIVSDRGYLALKLPLEIGHNALRVSATDAQGNARSQTREVVRIAVGSARLTRFEGHNQQGEVGSELPDPLSVLALDAEGLPLVNLPVRFDIVRGSGSLRGGTEPERFDGVNLSRNLIVHTDASGQAQVWLTVGREARPGSDAVRVWSEQIAEEVMFMASAERGAAQRVFINGASGLQYLSTDSQPVEALTAVVVDQYQNRLPNVPVEFKVMLGSARFNGVGTSADGQTQTVMTDRNGLAAVRPMSGSEPGQVVIQAEAVDADRRVGGAAFQLMVYAATAGPTQFAGLVQDHIGTPLAGVRLSIGRTALTALSDERGYFLFSDQVPPGKIDLFVDGRELRVERNGEWLEYPALHFETAVVVGQLNQLPHAVVLPPINHGQAKIVGGNQDVEFTLPGWEGFSMRVKANSVTFPDGSREGPLVVTPVHADRLPMVPPGPGSLFMGVAWTIQPTNTRFDPPIEVRIPNTLGFKPGETAPVVQWDHDLAMFVPMGRGTIDESGTQLITDPGSGITKAGWGGPVTTPTPAAPGPTDDTAENPPDCDCEDRLGLEGKSDEVCPPLSPECPTFDICDRLGLPRKGGRSTGRIEFEFDEVEDLTPPAGAIAAYYAYPDLANTPGQTVYADWKVELDAWCSKHRQWEFSVKRVAIKSKLGWPKNPRFEELDATRLSGFLAQDTRENCKYGERAELSLKYSYSSHYEGVQGGLPDGQNSEVAALLSRGVRELPPPLGCTNNCQWGAKAATKAHEGQHHRRFKNDVFTSNGLQRLVDLVERRTRFPVREGDTVDVAINGAALKNRILEWIISIHELGVVSGEYVLDPNQQRYIYKHIRPDDFYNCSVNSLKPTWERINSSNQALGCSNRLLKYLLAS